MNLALRLPARAARILENPLAFWWQVLRAFQANQGLLLAGAVAYYALLSIVPSLILMVVALSHLIDQAELFATLRRALEHVVPGRSQELVKELRAFLDSGAAIGWVLLGTMLFFSSLAFKVLETAMSVIFLHRFAQRRRNLAVSLLLPFVYILLMGALVFLATYVLADLAAFGESSIVVGGRAWSLGGVAKLALYLLGVAVEILLIASIYYFMPLGRLSMSHALIGGATAGVLWEIIRYGLMWYFGSLSQVGVLYGSLATAIIVLISLEIAATLLLFGAQVIAEYERFGDDEPATLRPAPPCAAAQD